MPQDENGHVTGGEGGEEIVHENGVESRIAALERNEANLQAREILSRVLSDPDIANAIKLKNAGKKVKVLEDAPEPEADDIAPELGGDLEDGDPQKALLSNISKLIDAKMSKYDQGLGELRSQVESVKGVADEVTAKNVSEAINQTRSRYRDFDQYRDGMVKLAKEMPGLGPEDYYLLAKHRAGKLRMVETATASEKPSSLPQSRAGKTPEKPKRAPGRRGFNDILLDSLSRINLESPE